MYKYENLFQKKLAEKFSTFYEIDLAWIDTMIKELLEIQDLEAVIFIDIESSLLLSAFCEEGFPLLEFIDEATEIFQSNLRMIEVLEAKKDNILEDVLITGKEHFSLAIPFQMLEKRIFLLYIQVKTTQDSPLLVKQYSLNIVQKLTVKYH